MIPFISLHHKLSYFIQRQLFTKVGSVMMTILLNLHGRLEPHRLEVGPFQEIVGLIKGLGREK